MQRFLIQGGESLKRVNAFFRLTKISSENIREALIDYLCRGRSESLAVSMNGVTQSNFNRALSRLNEVAGIVEEIKEDDWSGFNKQRTNQLSDIKHSMN